MAKTALVSLDEFMLFGPHELLIQKVINFMRSYMRDLYILTTKYLWPKLIMRIKNRSCFSPTYLAKVLDYVLTCKTYSLIPC